MNIAHNLENSTCYFPDRTAIIEEDRIISYSEFNRDANKAASAMASFGVRPGDHIALCAPNSYTWLVIYFGTLKAGAVAVTFSYLLKQEEFSRIISDCRPKILFTTNDRLDDCVDKDKKGYPDLVICEEGDTTFKAFVEKGSPDFDTIDRHRHDTAAILYTGGTTGTPKGAMLSHQNIQVSTLNVAHNERSTEDDLALCFLPLNHVFAQVHIAHATIFSAGGLLVQPAFDMENALRAIKKHKVTKFLAVPTIYIRLLEFPDIKRKMDSVRYCFSAAASMAAEVVKEWKSRTGLNIFECYGMTESAAIVTYNHYYRHVVGSVGTPANLVEVQIRDIEGNPVERGQEGEICISGPSIIKRYLNNPEETEAAFWGEWFRSGDIGRIDKDGYLFIVDRLKDMIITGGENVYPREIEEVLYKRPEILECAVVGLPDPVWGEGVTAFIVPQKDYKIDPASLKEFLKTKLAGFKVPKKYIEINELPKSSAGKILKRKLRKQYG